MSRPSSLFQSFASFCLSRCERCTRGDAALLRSRSSNSLASQSVRATTHLAFHGSLERNVLFQGNKLLVRVRASILGLCIHCAIDFVKKLRGQLRWAFEVDCDVNRPKSISSVFGMLINTLSCNERGLHDQMSAIIKRKLTGDRSGRRRTMTAQQQAHGLPRGHS